MADLDPLVAFLRARYDERQLVLLNVGPARVAWATFLNADGSMRYTSVVSANGDVWVCDGHAVEPHSVRVVFDRDQELADIAAKRQIVDACAWVNQDEHRNFSDLMFGRAQEARNVLRLLALPFAGHPDYDERWRP